MKLHHDIAHSGTLDGVKERMKLDENSLAVIQNMFIDLYANKALACSREYSTNAWDSHVEAGHSDPIEIELPTALRPVLVIRDHGVGLSFEEMRQVYFQYGASTKRESDDFNGQLGMGSKAALTYTSQFTVTGTKDGKRVMVLVTRETDGTGAFLKIAEEDTDEPNGVEIEIPVSNASQMIQAAQKFFQFWEPGRVQIDGVDGTFRHYLENEHLELDPDVHLVAGLDSDYILMGNVAYPCDLFGPRGRAMKATISSARHDENTTAFSAYKTLYGREPQTEWNFQRGSQRMRVVAKVDIGAVNFTPNREALAMTNRTEEVLAELENLVRIRTLEVIQYDIDSQPTHFKGMERAQRWQKEVTNVIFAYRGERIPDTFPLVGEKLVHHGAPAPAGWDSREADGKAWVFNPAHYDSSYSIMRYSAHDIIQKRIMFVTGYRGRGLRQEIKEKVRKWLIANDYAKLDGRGYYLTGEFNQQINSVTFIDKVHFHKKWCDDILFVPYEEIKAMTAPKAAKEPPDKRWRVLNSYGNETLLNDELIKPEKLCYIMAGDDRRSLREKDLTTLVDLGATVVILPSNRKARFLKTWPTAESIEEFVRRAVKELEETISSEAALLMDEDWDKTWGNWKLVSEPSTVKRILDPDVVQVLRRCRAEESNADTAQRLFKVAKAFHVDVPDLTARCGPARAAFGTLKGRYPFMEWVPSYIPYNRRTRETEHVLSFLNNQYIASTQVHLDPRSY